LREANLLRANLSDAYLFRADFGLANLSEANLSNADLFHANFLYTDLSGVDLNGATLISTNLRGAILDGAKFKGARLYNTLFINVDISEVKELEEVVHVGPSYIGIDTIYNSKGKIPHKFLMGAGVPESFIECMNSLTGNAFDYYSCFISYSSKDEDFAKRLYADLQTEGVRCWFAPEDLKIGQKIRHGIDEAIKIHDKLLIVLSESSVKSDWVEKEVETAFEKERKENKIVLFPVRLDDTVMDTSIAWAADIRRTRNIGDFKNWKNHTNYKKTFDRLMQDLKADETKATESSSV
ncbi:MAG: toll/interleukin-1 receptor domain-containing protein, partial [Ignavibacteriae bacterium]